MLTLSAIIIIVILILIIVIMLIVIIIMDGFISDVIIYNGIISDEHFVISDEY